MTRTIAMVVVLLAGSHASLADDKSAALAELEEAQDALDRGDLDNAIRHFAKARTLQPQSSGPLYGLGIALSRAGRCDEAVPTLEEYRRRKGAGSKADAIAALDACRQRKQPGKLSVVTVPSGAEVRIDDPESPVVGKTPYETSALSDGPHKVYLDKKGFQTGYGEFRIQVGSTAQVAFSLVPTPLEPPPQPPPRRIIDPIPPPVVPPPPPPPPVRLVVPETVAPGKISLEINPVAAQVRVNGERTGEPTRKLESPLAPGVYDVKAESSGYRAVQASLTVKSGDTVNQTFTLKPVRKLAWLGLAIPATLLAAGTGIGALVTFYAAEGQPLSPEFQTNKDTNAAMQGLFYPSLALAAVGYIVWGVTNRGRIADGPPLRVKANPGGLAIVF